MHDYTPMPLRMNPRLHLPRFQDHRSNAHKYSTVMYHKTKSHFSPANTVMCHQMFSTVNEKRCYTCKSLPYLQLDPVFIVPRLVGKHVLARETYPAGLTQVFLFVQQHAFTVLPSSESLHRNSSIHHIFLLKTLTSSWSVTESTILGPG